MQRLFLTSSGSAVARDIAKTIGKRARGMRLAFIKTAAEAEKEDEGWLRKDRSSLSDAGFKVFDYTLTGKNAHQLEKDLSSIDGVFLEGGNQFYLLQRIQQSGFAPIIQELVKKGVIYIGSSAGSQVAGPDLYPTYRPEYIKKAPLLKGYKGLGLVDFVVFPHWGSDNFKDLYVTYRMVHAYTTKHKIILLTDNQYVRVEGDMYKIEEVK